MESLRSFLAVATVVFAFITAVTGICRVLVIKDLRTVPLSVLMRQNPFAFALRLYGNLFPIAWRVTLATAGLAILTALLTL